MKQLEVLFVDDDEKDLPLKMEQEHIRRRYRLKCVLADPDHAVESALQMAAERPEIVGILTDRCDRPDFSHVREMRKIRPEVFIAVMSGHLSDTDRDWAIAAGANLCVQKGEPLDTLNEFFMQAADSLHAAERRLEFELAELLMNPDKIGSWVGVSRHGVVAECEDDLSVVHECEKTLRPDEFVVARVLPDLGLIEISDEWIGDDD